MKIRKYRPFMFTRMEEHADWLAGMARQGWHYKGGNALGFQYFEQGVPAEMVFSWDQAPRAKDNALAYRQECREAGWELAETEGRWYCWSKAVVPGEPVRPLRDKAQALAMFLDIQRQHSMWLMLMVAMCFLQFPKLFGAGQPRWITIAAMLAMGVGAVIHARDALYAKNRIRKLGRGG